MVFIIFILSFGKIIAGTNKIWAGLSSITEFITDKNISEYISDKSDGYTLFDMIKTAGTYNYTSAGTNSTYVTFTEDIGDVIAFMWVYGEHGCIAYSNTNYVSIIEYYDGIRLYVNTINITRINTKKFKFDGIIPEEVEPDINRFWAIHLI